jgi:DNA modification methylase
MSNLEIILSTNQRLEDKFASKMKINLSLNRILVSFQGNKKIPGYRWFKYKEGFSATLINYIFQQLNFVSGTVLDPFAGSGTTLFVASALGIDSVGIELLPIGCEAIAVRRDLLNAEINSIEEVIQTWQKQKNWLNESAPQAFSHLPISNGAFPDETELALGKYLAAAAKEKSELIQRLLRFAALCVLEDISYTRKDGQCLRWDYRSGRSQSKKEFNKGIIQTFEAAINQKLDELLTDIVTPGQMDLFPVDKKSGQIEIKQGSCLKILPTLATESFDCIVTSPPYCNRYDYTRTYALELAMLGMNESSLKNLRQELVSCTVENRHKPELQSLFTRTYKQASEAFDSQTSLQAILKYLEEEKAAKKLNNLGIFRMVRNYFFEMSLIIFECARILKPGAHLIMVNDNVRYQGANIPVDLILSDIAEKAGFEVELIWILPTGKGNSSQQMGKHGREELRKCIYIWKRLINQPAKSQDRQLVLV